jgi:TRAP-type mannitol/chloroaromatic compound transport system permease small subunit
MRKALRVIDLVNEKTGSVVRWFSCALVLIVVYDVAMRYLFTAPTMWAYETAMMVGAAMYALAFSYTHLRRGHVRVDVIYLHLSPRGRALVDVGGTLLFFFPLLAVVIGASFSWAWKAWITNEKSGETFWFPPIAPLRTIVAIGFCLLAFQVVAYFVRDLYLLLKGKAYD